MASTFRASRSRSLARDENRASQGTHSHLDAPLVSEVTTLSGASVSVHEQEVAAIHRHSHHRDAAVAPDL
ncbi:MAG: hypothetical protein U9R79_20040, partial [Armatimonadota bacterium]|nr:hypothetical protein [Armatimonadota bacterium]